MPTKLKTLLIASALTSVSTLAAQAEALKLAFADRGLSMADSDFVKMPTEGLLDPDYLASRAALIDRSPAGATSPFLPSFPSAPSRRWLCAFAAVSPTASASRFQMPGRGQMEGMHGVRERAADAPAPQRVGRRAARWVWGGVGWATPAPPPSAPPKAPRASRPRPRAIRAPAREKSQIKKDKQKVRRNRLPCAACVVAARHGAPPRATA